MSDVTRASAILRAGGLVAFPTETVYGLGADATNAEAVRRIFTAKGRPSTNPLIVHVADAALARRYASTWPESASVLAQRFWPGPLTLVLPKAAAIVDEATAGRSSVGLRVPDHPLALDLLRAFVGPVAAPSANRSNHVSPTTAQHVRDELGDAPDLILDGGPCQVGIESTVLDLSTPHPTILRPGSISLAQLEREIGPIAIAQASIPPGTVAASPGQHAVHYAPRATAYRFDRAARNVAEQAWRHAHAAAILFMGRPEDLLGEDPILPAANRRLWMPADPTRYARDLYSTLRQLDEEGVHAMWIEMPPDAPEWTAVRDRLTRATRPWPERFATK